MPLFIFDLHRVKARSRLPLLCLGLLGVLTGWFGAAGCGDDGGERYAYHVARSQGIFGAGQRLSATTAAGIVRECEGAEDLAGVCVRVGSPTARVRLSNGNIESDRALLQVSNLPDEVRWAVYLEPLLPHEPQDQRCAREQLGPPESSSTRLADELGEVLVTALPGCAALVFVQQVDETRPYRIAVLSGATLRDTELESFIAQIAALPAPPDFMYFLDAVDIRNARNSFEELERVMDASGLSWSMVISPATLRRGFDILVEQVGSLDYHTRIHGLPLVVLDTADSAVRSPQLDMLRRIRACGGDACAEGVALMSVPPVGTHKVDVGVFRSQPLAQSLLYELERMGTRVLISSLEDAPDSKRFSALTLLDVGRFQDRAQVLELAFVPPVEGYRSCDPEISIADASRITVVPPEGQCDAELEACIGGACIPRCESSADCAAPAHVCTLDGLCREPCGQVGCIEGFCAPGGYCVLGPELQMQRIPL